VLKGLFVGIGVHFGVHQPLQAHRRQVISQLSEVSVRYLTLHHNTFWFQIRVPISLRARYGTLVRVNLQTADRAVAHLLSLRLAAEWLTRFSLIAAGAEPLPAWATATAK
jgi:hypothetical protein